MVFLPVLSVNLSVKPSVIKGCIKKNPNHVIHLVYKQYEIAKDVMMEMQQSLKSGKRFSLSLDEYYSSFIIEQLHE